MPNPYDAMKWDRKETKLYVRTHLGTEVALKIHVTMADLMDKRKLRQTINRSLDFFLKEHHKENLRDLVKYVTKYVEDEKLIKNAELRDVW